MNYYQMNDTILEGVFYIPLFATPSSIIPSSTTVIGDNALAGIDSFSEIIIPPSVKIIKSGAFHDCKGLKKIIIPSTVEIVEDGAFANCIALEELIYSPKTVFYDSCFSGCRSLKYINDGETWARTFYYPNHNIFAIGILQSDLCTKEYKVYQGRFADEFFPKSKINFDAPIVYYVEIIKDNVSYVWYDTELPMAILGAQYQASGKSANDFFKKHWDIYSTMTPNEFSLLTGICYEGINIWLKVGNCGRDEPWPLTVLLPFLQENFPKIYQRLVIALEHQKEPVPMQFFINGSLRNQL